MQSAALHQEVGFISLDFNLEVEGENNVDCRGNPEVTAASPQLAACVFTTRRSAESFRKEPI